MKLGERRSLRHLYLRWGVMLLVLCLILVGGVARYYRDVSALSPEQLMRQRPEGLVRVMGRVKAGTLNQSHEGSTFELTGTEGGVTSILVRHQGKPYENMRALKVLVIEGEWDTGRMALSALNFRPLPNYGFVTAAYLLSMIPLVLFLFHMERSILLLSILIKEEKGYQPLGVEQT